MAEALPKGFKPKGRNPGLNLDWEKLVTESPDGRILRPERDFPEGTNVSNLVKKGNEYFSVEDKDGNTVPGDYLVGVYEKINIYVMPNE